MCVYLGEGYGICHPLNKHKGRKDFPGGTSGENQPANAGNMGPIPGSGRSLEKEMATHSSILAWRTPWTEEPGGLQSMGSQSQT